MKALKIVYTFFFLPKLCMHICLQINIIRITKQLELFEQYQQRVSALIGEEETVRLVNEALFLITLGGNDFVNNYFLVPFSARSRQFRLPDYVVYLISEYRKILAVYIAIFYSLFLLLFFFSTLLWSLIINFFV
jgi:hypothetical protein